MINVSESRLQTICLLFITAVLAAFGAYWLRPVLVPLVVAIFVVNGITPILEFLERSIASSRFMAAVIAFLFGALLLNLIMATLWASALDLSTNWSAYQVKVNEIIVRIQNVFPSEDKPIRPNNPSDTGPPSSQDEADQSPIDIPVVDPPEIDTEENPPENADVSQNSETSDSQNDDSSESTQSAQSDFQEDLQADPEMESETSISDTKPSVSNVDPQDESQFELSKNPSVRNLSEREYYALTNSEDSLDRFLTNTVRTSIFSVSQVFLELISTSIIVLIYVFFLMLGVPTESDRPQVINEIDQQIRSYLSLKTVISLLTGLAFGLALWFFGIPMALAFGMMAFFLNFIPNIGPIIASLLPLPLIIFDPGGSVAWMVLVIVVTSGIQFISGNVIEPRVMGQSSDLHPIVVLVALMFWGVLWGMVGMFLAVPITSGIKIALREFEQTKGIAEIMAGRWPKEMLVGTPAPEEAPTEKPEAKPETKPETKPKT